jgi:hypothetical protein
MDPKDLIAELHQQRERLDRLIVVAEEYARAGKRPRGRPPAWMTATRRGRPPGSRNKPKQLAQ